MYQTWVAKYAELTGKHLTGEPSLLKVTAVKQLLFKNCVNHSN